MRDWQAIVARHLADLALEPNERVEVIEELAAHLQESFEGLRGQGMTEEGCHETRPFSGYGLERFMPKDPNR
jgi:hypothetical protein